MFDQSVTTKSLLMHLSAFLWSCFGTYHDYFSYQSPNFLTYGGRFKYLTHCTAYLCLVVYGLAFLIDVMHLMSLSPKKKDSEMERSFGVIVRDYLVTMWSSNLSIFVVLMFWGVAAVDLEGIHPEEHQKIVPLWGWFNQYLHTTPALITLILLANVNYHRSSIASTVASIFIFGASYFAWMKHLSVVLGSWPYSFIDGMPDTMFVAFVAITHILMLILDLLTRSIFSNVPSIPVTQKGGGANKKRV